jgi:hypothetical protein
MLFREIIAVYSENYSKPLKNSVAKMHCCGMLRQTVYIVNQGCTNFLKIFQNIRRHGAGMKQVSTCEST